jgi:hypothetical protein
MSGLESLLCRCRRAFPLHIAQDGNNTAVAALAGGLRPYGIRYDAASHGYHADLMDSMPGARLLVIMQR